MKKLLFLILPLLLIFIAGCASFRGTVKSEKAEENFRIVQFVSVSSESVDYRNYEIKKEFKYGERVWFYVEFENLTIQNGLIKLVGWMTIYDESGEIVFGPYLASNYKAGTPYFSTEKEQYWWFWIRSNYPMFNLGYGKYKIQMEYIDCYTNESAVASCFFRIMSKSYSA